MSNNPLLLLYVQIFNQIPMMLSFNMFKAGVLFLLASGTVSSVDAIYPHTRKLKGDICRGEEVCLNQVCDPTSYQYNIDTSGDEFPFKISHKISDGSITFTVCPSKDAKPSCSYGSDGCSPLRSVKIRMRNDMLSLGRDLITEPQGQMWASCTPHGPGHVWNFEDLGTLSSQSPDKASCTDLTVVVNSSSDRKARLKDICQQGIKIVENTGWTVYDQKANPDSCLFVLETTKGRIGYTAVGGKSGKEDDKEEEKEEEKASAMETSNDDDSTLAPVSSSKSPSMYGGRVGVNSYGMRAAAMNVYGQRAGVSAYGQRRRVLNRQRYRGRRMM